MSGDRKWRPEDDGTTGFAALFAGGGHKWVPTRDRARELAGAGFVAFQQGPRAETGANGTQVEDLLEVAAERLFGFCRGPLPDRHTSAAAFLVCTALAHLRARTAERELAGVEGTNARVPPGPSPAAALSEPSGRERFGAIAAGLRKGSTYGGPAGLDFKRPTFKDGENVTCRRGRKWADMGLAAGSGVAILANGEPTGATAVLTRDPQIFSVDGHPGTAVPRELLALEHDPACRDRDGLLSEMRRVYGEGFSPYEDCTFLAFEIH